MSSDQYLDSVKEFRLHAISVVDEAQARAARGSKSRSASSSAASATFASVIRDSADPNAWNTYTVGVCPTLRMWSVEGTDPKTSTVGWKNACELVGRRVARADTGSVHGHGNPDKYNKKQSILLESWKPTGVSADGGSKKRSSSSEEPPKKRKPAGKSPRSTPAAVVE